MDVLPQAAETQHQGLSESATPGSDCKGTPSVTALAVHVYPACVSHLAGGCWEYDTKMHLLYSCLYAA